MYNNKTTIGLIFDKSYIIYDVLVPMDIIFTIMSHNRESNFVYGGIPRLCMHVEEDAVSLEIPNSQLHRVYLPCDERVLTRASIEWSNEVMKYKPDKIFLFRDNSHSTETMGLCLEAQKIGIPVMEFDERGHARDITTGTPSDLNPYFIKQPGRVPNDDF